MKRLVLLYLLLFTVNSLFAQRKRIQKLDIDKTDSIFLAMGYIPIQPKGLLLAPKNRWQLYKLPSIIDNDSVLAKYEDAIGLKLDSIDITKHILFQGYFMGDCHACFISRIYKDTFHKRLIWTVYNVWGRCRAMGRGKYIAFTISKPPIGYTIETEEILVDYLYNKGKPLKKYYSFLERGF